jgi:hypothetical protein
VRREGFLQLGVIRWKGAQSRVKGLIVEDASVRSVVEAHVYQVYTSRMFIVGGDAREEGRSMGGDEQWLEDHDVEDDLR